MTLSCVYQNNNLIQKRPTKEPYKKEPYIYQKRHTEETYKKIRLKSQHGLVSFDSRCHTQETYTGKETYRRDLQKNKIKMTTRPCLIRFKMSCKRDLQKSPIFIKRETQQKSTKEQDGNVNMALSPLIQDVTQKRPTKEPDIEILSQLIQVVILYKKRPVDLK